MLSRFCIILCFAIFCCDITQAQKKPGYVVTNEGDTLKGMVSVEDGFHYAPKAISFISGVNTSAYTVFNCQAFAVGDEEYQRAVVTMDMSFLSDFDHRIYNRDSTLTAAIFVMRIYKGAHLNLYKYHDGVLDGFVRTLNVKTHFFIEDNEKLQELVVRYSYSKERQWSQGDINSAITYQPHYSSDRIITPVYKEQLSTYYDFENEKRLKKRIDAMNYREDLLLKVVKEIDQKFKPLTN